MAFLLDAATQITCPHGGQGVATPSNQRVTLGGSPALVVSDQVTIAGCSFNVSGSPSPCVRVQWLAPANRVRVGADQLRVEHQARDLNELLLRQRLEDDDLVDPVDELRPEVAAQALHQLVLQLVEVAALAGEVLLSETVYAKVAERFPNLEKRSLMLRGKEAPTDARVLGAA